MKYRYFLRGISCFILIMLTIQALPAQNQPVLDITKLGVMEGDSFTYIILSKSQESEFFGTGLDPFFDTGVVLDVGDEFSMTVKNASPIIDDTGNYSLKIEMDYGEAITEQKMILTYGAMIIFTDWVYWESNQQFESPTSNDTMDGSISYVIDNGVDIFSTKIDLIEIIDFIDSQSTIHFTYEIHYNKTSGVLLYFGILFESVIDEDTADYFELAFAQRHYEKFVLPSKLGNYESETPLFNAYGFDLLLALSSLVIVTFIRFKKY